MKLTLALLLASCIALVASHSSPEQAHQQQLTRRHATGPRSHRRHHAAPAGSKKRRKRAADNSNQANGNGKAMAKVPKKQGGQSQVTPPSSSDKSSSSSPPPSNNAAYSPPSSSSSNNGGSSSSDSVATSVNQTVSSTTSALLSAITGFKGAPNTGIGSWFRGSNGGDSTNGHSWCLFPYNDASNVFAPSYKTMVGNFNGDQDAARKAYCGLEAIVKNPSNGKTRTMYIGDAFDDKWVITPLSIDIMMDAFADLNGGATSDKNVVIQNLQWTLTGQRSAQYTVNGPGN